MILSDDQQKAWDAILSGRNVFTTASAGAGKSYLIGHIRNNFPGRMLVTASTGIAANAIGGRTLHSQFRINPNRPDVKESTKSLYIGSAATGIKAAKLLIIDEISMVSEGLLCFVDEVCKALRRNSKPFGGLQLALFGDFLQLPPVSKDGQACDESCWEGPCWKAADIKTMLLTTNFRQAEDAAFFNLLDNLRYNRLTPLEVQLLYERHVSPPDFAIRLFATNQEVDVYNQSKFALLDPSTEKTYSAISKGKQSLTDAYWKNAIIPEQLVLRIGARVMMCINKNTDFGYLYNGATGTIKGFSGGYPIVEFDSDFECKIEPEIVYDYSVKDDNDVVIEFAQIVQVPLKLAWACTVHKSQGQTFDAVAMDCSRVFDYGQVYVALSRARTLHSLYLANLQLGAKGATSNPYLVEKYLGLVSPPAAPVPVLRKSLVEKYFS